mmetsp:Transcript_81828/g.265215  ORF Transcript_81828/g.265215 Transcript_81828/m.265215 type:complete len:120 (+) Transcript_81828:746-1105(+)
MAGANENIMQLVVNCWRSIEARFLGLGTCLASCAVALALARSAEALFAHRPWLLAGDGRVTGAGATPSARPGAGKPALAAQGCPPQAVQRAAALPVPAGCAGASTPLLLHEGRGAAVSS